MTNKSCPPPACFLTCCWYDCWQLTPNVHRSHVKGEGRMKARLTAFPVTLPKKTNKQNKTALFGSGFTWSKPDKQHETVQRCSESRDFPASPFLTWREAPGPGDAHKTAHIFLAVLTVNHLWRVNWAVSSFVKPICQSKSAISIWGPAAGAQSPSFLLRSHSTNTCKTMKHGLYMRVLVMSHQSGSPACQQN